jgi:hypothetical protein
MPALPLFFFLDAGNCFFGTPALVCLRWTPLDAVGSRWKNPLATKLRVYLVLPHSMPAKTPAGPKEAVCTEVMRLIAPSGI